MIPREDTWFAGPYKQRVVDVADVWAIRLWIEREALVSELAQDLPELSPDERVDEVIADIDRRVREST